MANGYEAICLYSIGGGNVCGKQASDDNLCSEHYGAGPTDLHLGMEADAPTVMHENGAMESRAPYAMTSIDPLALLRIAAIQKGGDKKYGVDNWRGISERDHINHALSHLMGHLAGDTSDDHLGNAAVRLIFALAKNLRPRFHGEATAQFEAIAWKITPEGQ